MIDPYEDLSPDTFGAVVAVTTGLVQACADRNVSGISALVDPVFQAHGTGGRFAVALAMAVVIEQGLGLDRTRERLVPGQRAMASVSIPWDVVLFDQAGYDRRIAAAAVFLSGYLSNQEPQLFAMFRDNGDNDDALGGLYELVAAILNPPAAQQR